MQAEKLPPRHLSPEEQLLVATEQQLLTDARQWLHRAADLYTQTSKIKIWVPVLCSCVITGYYLYNMHARAAAETPDLPAAVAESAPVAIADATPLSKGGAVASRGLPDAPTNPPDANASNSELRKQAAQAHSSQQFGDEAKLLQQFADRSATPQLACPALGTAYERAGEIDLAAKALEKCAVLEPGNVDTLVAFAHVLQTKRDFKRAAALYRQALQKDPRRFDAQTGLALIELQQNHLGEADTAARTILLNAPDNTDALLIAGIVAWRQSRLIEAEKIFEKGAGLDDRRADFHAFLGRIAEAERRPEDALRQYERSLVLDPNDTDITDRRDRLRNAP